MDSVGTALGTGRLGRSLPAFARAALAGAVLLGGSGAGFAADLIPFRMATASNIGFAPAFVMDEMGIAKKHGLDVQPKMFADGVAAMEASVTGNIDMAIMNATVALPVLANGKACFKGPIDYIALGSVQVVGRTDIKSAEDLVGKKVGTVLNTSGQIALHLWLDMHKIPRDKVQLVNVAVPDMPIALAKGEVDAIVATEPTPGLAIKVMGADKAHYVGNVSEAYLDVSPINITCAWASKYGDKAMEAVVAAWIESVDYVYANPQKAAEITAKRLQLTPEEVMRLWKDGGWLDNKAWKADLTDNEVDILKNTAQYLISVNRLSSMPDLGQWIDSRWLKAVAPDRVKLEKYKY